jgi:hypothetical protein
VFVDGVGLGSDSVVPAMVRPRMKQMGVPGVSTYSWVKIICKFGGLGPI